MRVSPLRHFVPPVEMTRGWCQDVLEPRHQAVRNGDARLSGVRRWAAGLMAGGLVAGCASPGPPRAPSLQLPQPVRDLSAARVGDRVELKFTVPQRTTDSLPIREAEVKATVCRGSEGGPCVPVASLENVGLTVVAGASAADRLVSRQDSLPAAETRGEPKLLSYRIEVTNLEGKTAGWSDPAYTAGGASPVAVSGLSAEETRAGVLLRWQAAVGAQDEVLVRRETVPTPLGPGGPPAKAKREETEPVWLESHASADETRGANETIDGSASEDTAYRYVAVRRRVVTLGEHKVELRSALSAPVGITWRNAFPPAAPVGLSAAPFAEGGAFAVDLVWEPVQEPGLKGYVVSRQADGGEVEKLTPELVTLPAFHDATAKPGVGYRYSVRAVSAKGVEGAAAMVVVEP